MQTDERRGLLKFVPPIFSADLTVLVIESENYLQEIRNLLPKARIAFLTTERDAKIAELCKNLSIDLLIGDYTKTGLPTEPKIFDIILAEDVLTYAPNYYVTLLELNHLLTDRGFLLTQFLNVRFVEILECLKRGEFPMRERRFWAKWNVVKILDDAIYKQIDFLPEVQFENISVEGWEKIGFDNFSNDLQTKIWLVRASKCEAEVSALKEIYTEEVRAKLARLLHRIEYKIDVEENISALKDFCEAEQIFADYLFDFVEQVVVHDDAKIFIKKNI